MRSTLTSGLAAFAAMAAFSTTSFAQSYVGPGGSMIDFAAGTWATATPATNTGPHFSSTVLVDVPVNTVDKVTITGWNHTWIGDVHVILVDPTGVGHNLMVRPFKSPTSTFGNSGDIIPTPHSFELTGLPVPDATPVNMPAGAYAEHYGVATAPWVAGNTLNGMVVNNGLAGIAPVATCGSTWTLKIYDWFGGDVGTLTGWTLDVNGPPTAPVAYCTGKVNSQGCTPAIGSIGNMSATCTTGFILFANNELNNKVGLVLYSEFGRDASPFGPGGIQCVKGPVRRSKGFNAGGNPSPPTDCSGTFAIDFNTFGRGLLGAPPNPATYLSLPGQMVTAQFWGRDPGISAPNNFSLSDGLEFFVGP